MKFLRLTVFILTVVLAGAFLAVAQDGSKKKKNSQLLLPERPVAVKANVKIVDASGNFVNDLKVENIKIFEDGVEQKITYLVRKEPVLNLGLVMDNTGSMRLHLDRIVPTAISFVDMLTGKDDAFVIRFVSSDKVETVHDWTADKFKLRASLENLFIEGGQSAVLDALYLAGEKMREREKRDRSSRCAIVLVSDVEERNSYYDLQETLAVYKDSDLQIFVVGIMADLPKNRTNPDQPKRPRETSERLAHTLALETGGAAYILGANYKKEDLIGVIKSIGDELRYQYVVGYTSANSKRDGSVRSLRVEVADGVKGEKRSGSIRESFVVPNEDVKK